jgi:MFS family permease
VLAQQSTDSGLAGLGMMIIASGLAGSLSAPVWGRLGDRSSRLVMSLAAACAGLLGVGVFALVELAPGLITEPWLFASLFLALAVFHNGVRLGRKVYLVDMATAETRASYVAISNTVIGVAMLGGGFIGVLGDIAGTPVVVLVLGLLALIAALAAWRLPEVSG